MRCQSLQISRNWFKSPQTFCADKLWNLRSHWVVYLAVKQNLWQLNSVCRGLIDQTESLDSRKTGWRPASDKLHSSVTSHHYAIQLQHSTTGGRSGSIHTESSVSLLRYFYKASMSLRFSFVTVFSGTILLWQCGSFITEKGRVLTRSVASAEANDAFNLLHSGVSWFQTEGPHRAIDGNKHIS